MTIKMTTPTTLTLAKIQQGYNKRKVKAQRDKGQKETRLQKMIQDIPQQQFKAQKTILKGRKQHFRFPKQWFQYQLVNLNFKRLNNVNKMEQKKAKQLQYD